MKKVILLATAFMFVTGVALADKGKRKRNVLKEKPAALKMQKLKKQKPAAKTRIRLQLNCNLLF